MMAQLDEQNDYWRYYGLRRDPFSFAAKESDSYISLRWEQYFDLLHYLCTSNNVLLAVTGAPGAGKTTFLKQFLRQLNEEIHVVSLTASPKFDVAQLCETLIKEFALPAATSENLDEQLETHIANLQYHERLALLVIDDAHRLPPAALRALLYFIKQQSENQMRLHILLVGESALKDNLAALTSEKSDQGLFHHLALEPFQLEETEFYLNHRLSVAGLPASSPLSRAAVKRIHDLARGIPAQINVTAQRILQSSMQVRPPRQFPWKLVGFILLGLIIVIILSMYGMRQQPVKKTVKPKPPVVVAVQPPPQPKPQPLPPAPAPVVAPAVLIEQAQQAIVLPKEKITVKPKQKPKQGRYTIQLMSVSREIALKKYIAAHGNDSNYFYKPDPAKNRYILFYGHYANEAEAAAALRKLPAELRQTKPWVKLIP